jgi:hypothetical protein
LWFQATLSLKNLISKITRAKWTGGPAGAPAPALQVKSPEFKPQAYQKTSKQKPHKQCPDGERAVFGMMKEGMNIVEAMEGFGSRNGKISKTTIADCGQL